MDKKKSTASTATNAEIKKQMEYYLGDKNLERDDFFRDEITKNKKGGYVALTCFLNCNKVKTMKITIEEIAAACTDSKLVELSDDNKSIRRKDNRPLPAQTGSNRKRDAKAKGKEEAKAGAGKPKEEEKVEEPEDTPVVRDEHGRI